MLGKHVPSDLELSHISTALPLQTKWGHALFTKQLHEPVADIKQLKHRQLPLLAFKHPEMTEVRSKICEELKATIAPLEETLHDCCIPKEELDPRIQESIHQIVWSPDSMGSYVNPIPHVLHGILTWKTLVLPGMAILMPLLAVIVPFILLRFLHGSDGVPVADYLQHVKRVVLSQVTIPAMLRAKHSGDVFGHMLEYLFIGITIATFISGIWNQITAAIHVRSLAEDVRARGEAIVKTVESCRYMLSLLHQTPQRFQKALRPFLEKGEAILHSLEGLPSEPLAAFGTIWNTPTPLRDLRDWIALLDVYTSITSLPHICFPSYTDKPLALRQVHHPLVKDGVPNNASFPSHVLLTGPNRGGKSTFCKAVGVSIVSAQTWGFAWATSMCLKPFTAIETALSPADELGRLSLFEAEIEFAKEVLARCDKEENTLVMMDEIFHSTNARDGVAASHVFLDKLYAKQRTTSLISTHYRELVEHYQEKGILPWAMDAKETDTGLEYSYRVTKGISDKSSVMEILKERGLV